MKRAYYNLSNKPNVALIDGNFSPDINCKVLNIIKGDTKSLSIAAASIIAKVHKDKKYYNYCIKSFQNIILKIIRDMVLKNTILR